MITSSAITVNRPYGNNGLRKIREVHTDHTEKSHTISYIADAETDINSRLNNNAIRLNNSLIESEQQRYISDVEKGLNPFEVTPNFTEINEMRAVVLKHFLAIQDPTGLTSAVTLLAIMTDEELITLLTIDQTKVDEIRARAVDVVSLSADIDNYIAPLEIL